MERDKNKINCMYVTRDDDGTINLFGAYNSLSSDTIIVFESTKNVRGIGQMLYGEEYTNEYIIERMKERPTHNFIGVIAHPVTFACDDKHVKFV